MDAEMDGMATGLSTAICRDGQSTTTARIPFAAGTSAAAGSTASVSYAQTNDSNTGMYFPATDQWGLVAGGVATLTSTATKLTATVAVDFTGAAAPTSSDGAALGSTTQMWSDLFLASGGVVNWDNGDVTITHASNALTFGGATTYSFTNSVLPSSNDGAPLGASGTAWSDLFLASGAVINFNAGDVTVTHSANTITVAGGTLAAEAVTATSVTSSNGLTVSGGSVDLPAGSVADADLATPGRLKFIFGQTASGASTVDFTASNAAAAFDGTYDRIVMFISNMTVSTDDTEVFLRVGTGAGPTYQTTNYKWQGHSISNGAITAIHDGSDSTKIHLTRSSATTGVGNASGESLRATISIDTPDDGTLFKLVSIDAAYYGAFDGMFDNKVSGCWKDVTALTAIRILLDGGTMSGRFALYGVNES